MSRRLEDFTVRVNLEGWHMPGEGTCWAGQEFQGKEILPRMIQALEQGDKFKFQGRMVDVCVLRGGTLEELMAVHGKAAQDIDVSKPVKKPKPAPVEPEPDPEISEDDDDEDDDKKDEEDEDEKDEDEDDDKDDEKDDDEEEEDLQPIKKVSKKKKIVRRPRKNR